MTKTYDELKEAAAKQWAHNAEGHASRMQTLREQIANSPDVQNAPAIGSLYANDLIQCPCGGKLYNMLRYACVNGVKYRTEIKCTTCQTIRTWDFTSNSWLS